MQRIGIHVAGLLIVVLASAGLLITTGMERADEEPARPANAIEQLKAYRVVDVVMRGTRIGPSQVELVEAPPGADTLAVSPAVFQRRALRDIPPSSYITARNTTDNPAAFGLAGLIEPGRRAVAVRVSDEIAVANLVRPGDLVDLVLVSQPQSKAREGYFPDGEARTVLQAVPVVAVGPALFGQEQEQPGYKTITLSLTPQEANRIALTRVVGTYHLTLRGLNDDAVAPVAATSTADLVGEFRQQAIQQAELPAPGRGRQTIEFIHGTERRGLPVKP